MAFNNPRFQSNTIREPCSTIRYVHIESDEFKSFIRKLEQNYEQNSAKMSACLLCWGFLTSYQKQKHLEHAHYTITPSFLKNQDMYMKHAKAHEKLKENGTMVALLNEQCKIIVGNPYVIQPSMSQTCLQQPGNQGSSQDPKTIAGNAHDFLATASQAQTYSQNVFGRVPANQVLSSFQNNYTNVGQQVGKCKMPMNSLSFNQVKDVQQRQFDQEQIIKKLTLNVMCLQDKMKAYDQRIRAVELKLEAGQNKLFQLRGKDQEKVIFKKENEFIETFNEKGESNQKGGPTSGCDTAETMPNQDSQGDDKMDLPVPGIDSVMLMGSQVGVDSLINSKNATMNTKISKLDSMRKNCSYDHKNSQSQPTKTSKQGFTNINQKSKGISKSAKTTDSILSPKKQGKAVYMNRGSTLMVQDMDGPTLATYTTRDQDQYKSGAPMSESQVGILEQIKQYDDFQKLSSQKQKLSSQKQTNN